MIRCSSAARRRAISTLLVFLSLFQVPFAQAAQTPQFYLDQFGKTEQIRRPDSCGIYLAPASYQDQHGNTVARYVDNSTGYKLADLDVDNPRQTLKELQAALSQMIEEGGRTAADGDLAVTGLPEWGSFAKDFEAEVAAIFKDLGIELNSLTPSPIKIVPMYAPTDGVKGAVQKLLGLRVKKQDYEKPLPEEVKVGALGAAAGEVTTAIFALTNFPITVSAPMLFNHFFGLIGLTAYIRTVVNWQNRSPTLLGKLFKQSLTSLFFVMNYNVVAQWPKIWEAARAGQITMESAGDAIQNFGINQGVTTAVQTAFFFITFGTGIYPWQGSRSTSEEASRDARRATAVFAPAIFWITGPLLGWASTSKDVVFQVGDVSINPGQIALAGATVAGSVFWIWPQVLDPAARFVNEKVYPVIDGLVAKVKHLAYILRLAKPPAAKPPEGK
jgi:hypothetical protein